MQYNYVKNQKLFDMIIKLSYFSRLTFYNHSKVFSFSQARLKCEKDIGQTIQHVLNLVISQQLSDVSSRLKNSIFGGYPKYFNPFKCPKIPYRILRTLLSTTHCVVCETSKPLKGRREWVGRAGTSSPTFQLDSY